MPSKAARAFGFGDVVLVPFPFTNQTTLKKRPAVVVSSAAYGAQRPDIVLMAITSQVRPSPTFGDVWLRDWQGAGLLKPSAVKPLLATFEQALVIRRLRVLNADDQRSVAKALEEILGRASAPKSAQEEPDKDKIDDATLALLLLGLHEGDRVWKGFDWDTMDRLHDKGLIYDPKGKAKSVALTKEGQARAEQLFAELFGG